MGPGISIVEGSVVLKQAGAQSSIFYGASTVFGDDDMEEGVVLTTGNVHEPICKTNQDPGTSTSFAQNAKRAPGDRDLQQECIKSGIVLNCGAMFDTVSLEFDFETKSKTTMNIKYVFASEEYPEFVQNLFADSFAFFVDGENIALTEDGNAVSIGSINCYNGPVLHSCMQCSQYKDNWGSTESRSHMDCSGWVKRSKGFYKFYFDGVYDRASRLEGTHTW